MRNMSYKTYGIDHLELTIHGETATVVTPPAKGHEADDDEGLRVLRELREAVADGLDAGEWDHDPWGGEGQRADAEELLRDIDGIDLGDPQAWANVMAQAKALFSPAFDDWRIDVVMVGDVPTEEDRDAFGTLEAAIVGADVRYRWETMPDLTMDVVEALRDAVAFDDQVDRPFFDVEVYGILDFLMDHAEYDVRVYTRLGEAEAFIDEQMRMTRRDFEAAGDREARRMADWWLLRCDDPRDAVEAHAKMVEDLYDYATARMPMAYYLAREEECNRALRMYMHDVYDPANWVHGNDPIDGPTLAEWYADAPLR